MLDRILAGEFKGCLLLITYKERLTRFNYGIFQKILSFGGVRVIILNKDENEEQDLMTEIAEDVASLLCHMNARLNGQKSAQRNTKTLTKETINLAVQLHESGWSWWSIVQKLKDANHRTINGDVVSYHVLKKNVTNNINELLPVVGGGDENTNTFAEWAAKGLHKKRGAHTPLRLIHACYERWALQQNIEPLTSRRCSNTLRKEMGLESTYRYTGHCEYMGVELVEAGRINGEVSSQKIS